VDIFQQEKIHTNQHFFNTHKRISKEDSWKKKSPIREKWL